MTLIPQVSLPELLFSRDARGPAMVDAEEEITYPELARRVRAFAGGLRARGVARGEVVGIRLGNGIPFAVAFHGVLTVGAVAAPIAAGVPDDLADWQLGQLDAVLTVDSATYPSLAAGPEYAPDRYPDPADLAALPFSSGTTGSPKAVELTHANLVANTVQFAERVQLSAGQTCLSVLPFSHIYGLTALLNVPLYLGARVVAIDFSPEAFLRAHERYHVHTTFIAPPLATLLARHPLVDQVDFSALRFIVSGAAPLNVSTAKRAQERVGARIVQGFGMTEASPVTHLTVRDDTPLASIGDPLPETEAKIVDPESLEELDFGQVGELLVRGPQVMRGYYRDPEATAQALADGWLRTGDLATMTPDGQVTIIDRLKDLIKSHGFSVSPVRLEGILLTHPAVDDCAVIRGNHRGEECPVAAVVLRHDVESSELMRYVAARVAPYEQIREVRRISAVPRSAAGKILRRSLVLDSSDTGDTA